MRRLPVATRIDEQTHRALSEIAAREDRTIGYLLRKAAERYVEEEAKRAAAREKE